MNMSVNFTILKKAFLWALSLIVLVQQPLYTAEGNEEESSSTTEDKKTSSETQDETPPLEEEPVTPASETTSDDKPLEEKAAPELNDEHSLTLVRALLEKMKGDSQNHSYNRMLYDKVLSDHTLEHHGKNPSFFYINNKFIINKIISLVMSDPDGIIDETSSTGYLKIYRDFNYSEQIEPLLKNEIRPIKKFYDEFLGQTKFGPTNRVIILLKIKGDEQNETSFEKRIVYRGNNIAFIDAYPAQGPLTLEPEESKNEGGAAEEGQEEEPKAEEAQAEEPKTEEPQAEEGQAEEPKAEEAQTEEPQAEEGQAEEPKPEESQAEEPKAEESQAEEPKAEEAQAEEPKAEEAQAEEGATEETKSE
jgi:hypothetical protein